MSWWRWGGCHDGRVRPDRSPRPVERPARGGGRFAAASFCMCLFGFPLPLFLSCLPSQLYINVQTDSRECPWRAGVNWYLQPGDVRIQAAQTGARGGPLTGIPEQQPVHNRHRPGGSALGPDGAGQGPKEREERAGERRIAPAPEKGVGLGVRVRAVALEEVGRRRVGRRQAKRGAAAARGPYVDVSAWRANKQPDKKK